MTMVDVALRGATSPTSYENKMCMHPSQMVDRNYGFEAPLTKNNLARYVSGHCTIYHKERYQQKEQEPSTGAELNCRVEISFKRLK